PPLPPPTLFRSASLAGTPVPAAVVAGQAQPAAPSGYLLPPKVIVDTLDAAPPPTVYLSSTGDAMAVLQRDAMPPLADIAQPMLRLGGIRINPKTNGMHAAVRYRTLTIKSPVDASERKVTLPPSPAIRWIGFSPDGARFAFMQTHETRNELWVGQTATGQARAITEAPLNATLGRGQDPGACEWVGQGASLLCAFTVADRGAAPEPPAVPLSPNIQETRGVEAPVRTYQDLLGSAYDEKVFEYYVTSQLAFVDAASGERTPVGQP